ncbi:hypothetical protein B0H10DRAFT_2444553 [Mycena sp. CBHHK59/15]|nr:hypothetical protein B0H10DRAFT_2444553 [Mycena sp. CBHHK59/15]
MGTATLGFHHCQWLECGSTALSQRHVLSNCFAHSYGSLSRCRSTLHAVSSIVSCLPLPRHPIDRIAPASTLRHIMQLANILHALGSTDADTLHSLRNAAASRDMFCTLRRREKVMYPLLQLGIYTLVSIRRLGRLPRPCKSYSNPKTVTLQQCARCIGYHGHLEKEHLCDSRSYCSPPRFTLSLRPSFALINAAPTLCSTMRTEQHEALAFGVR